jgi:DNA helicase-2/ATP-dependent DNA helicase PcrA
MTAAPYLASLNEAQRCAVEHGVVATGPNVAGPLLVIAGAGSGKTNTLAHRVAHLIVNGADPGRILLLTFSRRAAAEMERRAQRLIASATKSDNRHPLLWSGTFHALGARLLRMYATSIGLDPGFTIHDREDSGDLMNVVRHDLGLSGKGERFPLKGTCLSIYSRAVNAAEPLEEVLRKQFPWCASWETELRALFDAYVEAKQAQHVLDYDDLLLYWGEVMKVPDLARDIGDRFDHVLVDEYQDTNALQAAILRGLKPDGAGLMVVGDDAQAIYGFRAATVRNIMDFPSQFPSPARLITLEQNYRSTQPILAASNAVIGLARERFTKNLRSDRTSAEKPYLMTVQDDAAQAECIVAAVLENREAGTALKEQAVLFRTSHHSALLEIELSKSNIPFVKFGGLKFIEAAHVKDMLSVLRWAENPADRVTGFRVLQLLEGRRPDDCRQGARPHGWHIALRGPGRLPPAGESCRGLEGASRPDGQPARQCRRLAGGIRAGASLVSAASGAALRRRRGAHRRSRPAAAHRGPLTLPARPSSPISRSIRRVRRATKPAPRAAMRTI